MQRFFAVTGWWWTAIVALFAAMPVTVSAAEDDLGTWLTVSTTDAFETAQGPSRWHYWFDAQARYFDIGSGTNQWLVRPGIGYRINESTRAWAGYARFRSRNRSGNTSHEDRLWQQVDWSAGRWRDGTVSLRARLEQRSVSTGDDLGLVVRFMAKYVRPIESWQNASLVLAIEPFVNLRETDWGGDAGLRQNRAIVGVGWRLNDRVAVETGYMNQYIWVDGAQDRNNHLAVLTFKVNL